MGEAAALGRVKPSEPAVWAKASEECRIPGREIMEETYRDTSVPHYLDEHSGRHGFLLWFSTVPAFTQADGIANYGL